MSTINQRMRRTLALATAIGALAGPVAWAGPIDPADTGAGSDQVRNGSSYSSVNSTVGPVEAPESPTSAPATVSGDGFDWGDAGLGAGAMLGLTAMAAVTALALRHRPRRGHTVA